MNNKDKTGSLPLTKSPYRTNIPTTLKNANKTTNKVTPAYIASNLKQSTKSNSNVLIKSNNNITSLPTTTSHHIKSPSTSSTASPIVAAVINNDTTTAVINKSNEIGIEADNPQRNALHNLNQTPSFATITSNEKTPSREQALVFNSIDGIRQVEYILEIAKLISPKDIIYVSRISNNRFCIFLSSKDILETLLGKSETISINEHTIPMRRLINSAKKITLSNVCPSIPNQTILNELKKIDIIPVSQINHIKAGINIEGFEHIRSFRRQMLIKQEDINKLPGSLVINNNQTLFRIFFTDDKIICFLCKGVGHTTASCKKHISPDNPQYIQPHKPPQTRPNQNNTFDEHPTSILEEVQPPDFPTFDETNLQNYSDQHEGKQDETITPDYENIFNCNIITETPIENPTYNPIKRPLSDTNSPMSPTSPTTSSGNFPIAQPDKKKPKVISRSNSLITTQAEASKIDIALQPAEELFTSKLETPITFIQFKYILENFTNKSININSLCEEANIDNIVLMDLIEEVKKEIKDRTTKARLTKLSNLLFQAAPSPPLSQN